MNIKKINLGFMFLLVVGIVFAVQGENLAYYFNVTGCSAVPDSVGCSATINWSCNITNPHLIEEVNLTINDVIYDAGGYGTYWYTYDTDLNFSVDVNHTLSLVTIEDTLGNKVLSIQNLTAEQSCCSPDWVANYESCRTNDTQVKYYTDANACGSGSPPSNETIACDYCVPDWFCSKYENFTEFGGADCDGSGSYYNCENVSDTHSCYSFTGQSSDLFSGNVSLYDLDCSQYYIDLVINYYIPYWEDIQLTLSIYYSYPYVDINESVWMEVTARWDNGTNLEIDSVQMDVDRTGTNESWLYNFTWDSSSESYWQELIWEDESKIGDYPFVITGSDDINEIFGITGTFLVRQMIEVNISLYTEKNITSNEWINDFGYIFITEESNAPSSDLALDLVEMVEPLERTVLFTEKLAGLNKTTMYTYGKNVWYAPYEHGLASVKIPLDEEQVYGVKFANANSNMDWQMPSTNYGTPASKSADKFSMIDLGSYYITRPSYMKFYVSKYDRNWLEVWTRAGIIIVLGSLAVLILFLVARATQDPVAVVKLATALLVALPILYGILKWILL